MTDSSFAPADDVAAHRDRRLVSVLSRARRGGRITAEGWMITAGSALAVLGVVLVIIGWVGTSRTVLVAGQIPYVVSGGLLGLGLIFLGGFLYFAYWQALMVRQGREDAERNREDIGRLEAGLAEAAESLAVIAKLLAEAPPARGGRRASASSTRIITVRPDRLVMTPSGTLAHKPTCAVVVGRTDLHEVSSTGARLCGICHSA